MSDASRVHFYNLWNVWNDQMKLEVSGRGTGVRTEKRKAEVQWSTFADESCTREAFDLSTVVWNLQSKTEQLDF